MSTIGAGSRPIQRTSSLEGAEGPCTQKRGYKQRLLKQKSLELSANLGVGPECGRGQRSRRDHR